MHDRRRATTALALAALLTACNGGLDDGPADPLGPPPAAPPPGTDAGPTAPPPGADSAAPGLLPCDVAEALETSCQECHASTPRFGAPMPLTTLADLHAPAVSDPSRRVLDLLPLRLEDPEAPMPPGDRPLSDEHRAALHAFVAAAGPRRPDGDRCDGEVDEVPPPPVSDTGPEALPCAPTHRFLAHDGGAGEHQVRVEGDGNGHMCFAFPNPFAPGEQATAWAPVLDEERVLHHWIVWGSDRPPPGGREVFACPTVPHTDAAFVMGWAPGATNNILPEDVGLVVEHQWLYLQIHYFDATGAPGVTDASGVAVCTTPTPRAQAAGVLALGDLQLNIPPRARDHDETFTCPTFVTDTWLGGDFTIIGSGPHMHELGTRFVSEVVRADGRREDITRIGVWDFNDQRQRRIDPGMHVGRGDTVSITCTYDNPHDAPVRFGENTQDEMCFDFLLVYPIDRWPSGIPRFCANIGLGGF